MNPKILGVSGSPINNSNTDRAVKAILKASGYESKFIKLSEINLRPCQACRRCVQDNICKQEDDFPALARKIKEAKAIIIGAYCPYSMIDAYTKAFLERLWSMRHVNALNTGKLAAIIVTGVLPSDDNPIMKVLTEVQKENFFAMNKVSKGIEGAMGMEGFDIIGTVKIRGNVPCLTCGEGTDCKKSGVPGLFGKGTIASSELCVKVEDQPEVWGEIQRIGKVINERLS